MSPQLPTTLIDLLRLLATGAGGAALLSVLAQRSAWFNALQGDRKLLVVLLIAIGLPLISTAVLLNVPVEVLASLDPYYTALAVGLMTFLATQVVYRMNNPVKPTALPTMPPPAP